MSPSTSQHEGADAAVRSTVAEEESARTCWHQFSAADAFARLHTTHNALGADEVQRRRAEHGANRLTEAPPRSPVAIFVAQFADFMVMILIGAAIVSGLIGDLTDT